MTFPASEWLVLTRNFVAGSHPQNDILRYQSQLLFRKGYKPGRILRIKPATKQRFSFRPVRFGVKPQIKTYEC